MYSLYIADQPTQGFILNERKKKNGNPPPFHPHLIYSNDMAFYLRQNSPADALRAGIKSAFIATALVSQTLHIPRPSWAHFSAQSPLSFFPF